MCHKFNDTVILGQNQKMHLPTLIEDLSLILITAAVVILLFRQLKQPVVLGYLIAGFLVSRHSGTLPTVKDPENIKIWGEIGVIFLLFGLGLEFSFKKLASVGKAAATTGIFEIVMMFALSFLVGQLFGWSKMDSLFLGGILSISSTTIIVRAIQELGLKNRRYVSLVFGVLIVEDLIAILLLVLLSTLAVTKTLSGSELLFSSLRLGFFLVLWFVVGIYVLPTFLEKIKKILNDETTLIVAIGLCLLMVIIATNVGFSPALGAFVMGSLLAETKEGRRIEHALIPVRDLFAAVFFVSVGMLIDPEVLVQHWEMIIVITLLTIGGKFLSTSIGSLVAGKDLRQATQTGLALAQIGEFSFIIATLGTSLKVTSDFLYPVAVAVSAITAFTTPYQIKYSDQIYNWFEKHLPLSVQNRLKNYESALSTKSRISIFTLIWKEYGLKILLNSVVVVAISLGLAGYGLPWIEALFPSTNWIRFGVCLATLLVCAPFLWAIVIGAPAHAGKFDKETETRINRLQFGLSIVRALWGLFLAVTVITEFYSIKDLAAVILVSFCLLGIFFSRFAEPLYKILEKKFIANLNEKDRRVKTNLPELAPWDAVLAECFVSPNSRFVGQSLFEARLQENYGVMVTMMARGNKIILAPKKSEILYPYDKLYMIGSEDFLNEVRKAFEVPLGPPQTSQFESFGLESTLIQPNSPYLDKPIRDCGLREAVDGIIVGIERNGERILSPSSDTHLKPGDVVWLVGNKSKIANVA